MRKIKYLFFKLKMRKKQISINSILANQKAKYDYGCSVMGNTYIGETVAIGKFSYINCNSCIEDCDIGSFCSIASNVNINPFMHPKNYISSHPFVFNKIYGFVEENIRFDTKRVFIGNDVWIGLNVIIMGGCSIGNGAIIAAGAVVTHDVPSYEIWGGVPAKKIGDRFKREDANYIEATEWWNWDIKKIKEEINNFKEIDKFRNLR